MGDDKAIYIGSDLIPSGYARLEAGGALRIKASRFDLVTLQAAIGAALDSGTATAEWPCFGADEVSIMVTE